MSDLTSTNTSTNKGWDLVSSMNNSGLTYFIEKFIPRGFQLPMPNNVIYAISPSFSGAAAEIINDQNIVKITIPITGTATTAGQPAIEAGSTMSIQFDISQMVISKKEDGPVGTVYISWKSSNISLTVTSSLVGGVDETTFNTQMETVINQLVVANELALTMNLRFGVYGKIIRPTYWNFITLANGGSYQLTALSMFDYVAAPTGNQNSIFQGDTAIMIPDNSSNLIVSLADYTILGDVETFLINKGFGLFDEDSFEITEDNGQSALSLVSKIALVKNLFIYLLTFTVNIVPKGLKFLLKLTTPIVIFDDVTATLNAVPEQTREAKGQAIDLTLQDTEAPVVANVGCIISVALIICLPLLYIALAFSQPQFLILVLLVIILAIIAYFIFKSIADKMAGKLSDKMDGFHKTRYNKNQNFFIKDIVYNEAIIMQGIIGSPDISMTIANTTTQTPVVYSDVGTSLNITLANNTQNEILLNDSNAANPTSITIQLPDFFNSSDFSAMSIDQEDWDFQFSGQTLVLTNKSVTTWSPGAENALNFTIEGVNCSNETNATDSVYITIVNTSYPNEMEPSTRLSLKQFQPNFYPITWNITDQTANDFTGFTQLSGTATVDSTTNTFISLTTASLNDTIWEFGYQFTNNAKGQPTLAAMLKSTGIPSQAQNGTYLPLDSTETSKATYKAVSGNTGIAITFTQE